MDKQVSFYIAKGRKSKTGFVPIYGQVTILAKNYPFQIDKVKERYWSKDKQRVREQRQGEPYNRHKEINSKLDSLSKDTSRFNRFASCIVSPERTHVKAIFFDIKQNEISINEAYQKWLDLNEFKVSWHTHRNRSTVFSFLKRYQEESDRLLQFSDVGLPLFYALEDFALKVEEKENNTWASAASKFKTFLNWCAKQGYYTGTEHKQYQFAERDKAVIYLSPDEFSKLLNHEFKSLKYDKARDLYCFACLTGLRYEDIRTLRREHIRGDEIHKRISKTKEILVIPLLPQAKKILSKYEESFYPLPKLSNQKANEYIKVCCKKSKIKTKIFKEQYKGNQVISKPMPKHKLITFHTARKTFITIGFMKGLNVQVIKSITGHKSERSFNKYLKIPDELKRKKLENAWSDL